MKTCRKCGISKEEGAFCSDRAQPSGYRPYCRACENARVAAYKAANPGKVARIDRNKHLKKKYGIDIAGFDSMLAVQGGVCAICGTDTPGGKGDFHVDHDHRTGKVRGLLCTGCNTGLGAFRDETARLLKAVDYLVRSAA